MAPKCGPKWVQIGVQNEAKMGPKTRPKTAPKTTPKTGPNPEAKMVVFHWFYKEKPKIRSQGAESACEILGLRVDFCDPYLLTYLLACLPTYLLFFVFFRKIFANIS